MSFVPGQSGRRRDVCWHPGISLVSLAVLWLASGAAADEAVEPSEPGDIKFVRQAAGMDDVSPASFPHWIHRMSYTCYACHDTLFTMKAGANLVTMDQIQGGQSCGVCHDGKTAFVSNLTTCNRCHR